jgi:hypothetical protein
MSLAADVAYLKGVFTLEDNATPNVNKIKSSLGGLGGAGATAGSALSVVERGAVGMGNALNHAKGFVSNLVSGPLGLIGLGAGLLTVGGAIKETIGTANDLASAIEKLAPLTGDTAEQISGLLAVFNKFGISTDIATTRIAFMEKAVGTLALSSKSAAKFQAEFGFSVLDSSGKVKDANTLILQAADYWKGSASAAEKAAFEAKLFGRGFADMIPILNLGSKGILDAEKAAASLGLTLTATNVQDLQKYQAQMRETGDVIGGLKLQITLGLLPTITDLAKGFASFITDHRTDITTFFKNAVSVAKEVGGALSTLGRAAAGAWSAIPPPLRDLMLQALIGNKVIKTVFGINILGTVEGAVGSIIGQITSKAVAATVASKIMVQHVWVDNPGFGGPGGGPATAVEDAGGAAAIGGSAGLAADVAAALGPLAIAAMVPLVLNAIVNSDPQKTAASALNGRQQTAAARGLNPGGVAGLGFGGPSSSALPPGVSFQDYGKQTSAIQQGNQIAMTNWSKAIAIWNAVQKVDEQAVAHQASEKTIAQIAGSNHNFLELFRSGNAKTAVKFFPAEYKYLSTVSDQTKHTAVYTSSLKQDIAALKLAEVNATGAQKIKLAADIVTLQNLVKATTAAVYSVGAPGPLMILQNTKDAGSSIKINTSVSTRDVNMKHVYKNRYGPDISTNGNK